MNCEACKKEMDEGNYINVPCHKKTHQGIIPSYIHIILCDECSTKVMNKISGSSKINEAELVKTEEITQ